MVQVMSAHLHFRAVVVGDKMDGSSPAFLRMVAQQYICAGNDHEGFGSVTEAAEDPAQRSEKDPPSLCVPQKNGKPHEACDAI